jgi:hypothetical protein
LGRASQSDEEDRFDATALQKTREVDERKDFAPPGISPPAARVEPTTNQLNQRALW